MSEDPTQDLKQDPGRDQDQIITATPEEALKRRRERRWALGLVVLFAVSTLFQAFIADKRQSYGFLQGLLYFGLLHLNLILIMLLFVLATRNLVKAYLLRRSGKLGSSLRWKMVTSLLVFSILPSVLLFVGSSAVMRLGFDQWFSGQVSTALEDAQAISEVHYSSMERNLEFYGKNLATQIRSSSELSEIEKFGSRYPLQSLEVYLDLVRAPKRYLSTDTPDWSVPRASIESLARALKGESFFLVRQYGDGDLIQRFQSFNIKDDELGREISAVIVVSHTVPLGLKSRITDLRSAFLGYKKIFSLKDSLKTNTTLIFLTLFILTLFLIVWLGVFIARAVTEPVAELMKATEKFREGDWGYRIPLLKGRGRSAYALGSDLEILKNAFNTMAEEVGTRGHKLEEANVQLMALVRELEERENYLETLLSSIRRGVLVFDSSDQLSRVNTEAQDILGSRVTHGLLRGSIFRSFVEPQTLEAFLESVDALEGRPVDRIFELRSEEGDKIQIRSIRFTGILLLDEQQRRLGTLFILEDVSDAARLERLAAWQEVARRVAHEIKNPLTPIQISADRLQRKLAPQFLGEEAEAVIFRDCLGQIQKQVRVIKELVKEFSQFAKLPEPKFQSVNLLSLIEKILSDYRFTHPQVRFEFENHCINANADGSASLPGDPLMVRADAEYLRRLVVNLADNSLHAMEESQCSEPFFRVRIGVSQESSDFFSIDFEDGGPGVKQELREKIFDPYVTSKASGLGLGLPIVRRIAIEHGGRIRCVSWLASSRFVLEIPRLNPMEGRSYGEIATDR